MPSWLSSLSLFRSQDAVACPRHVRILLQGVSKVKITLRRQVSTLLQIPLFCSLSRLSCKTRSSSASREKGWVNIGTYTALVPVLISLASSTHPKMCLLVNCVNLLSEKRRYIETLVLPSPQHQGHSLDSIHRHG